MTRLICCAPYVLALTLLIPTRTYAADFPPLLPVGTAPPHPVGLSPGHKYRYMIVTRAMRDATSSDIAVYDQFVDNDADHYFQSNWTAVFSTPTVSAIEHIASAHTPPTQIFNILNRQLWGMGTSNTITFHAYSTGEAPVSLNNSVPLVHMSDGVIVGFNANYSGEPILYYPIVGTSNSFPWPLSSASQVVGDDSPPTVWVSCPSDGSALPGSVSLGIVYQQPLLGSGIANPTASEWFGTGDTDDPATLHSFYAVSSELTVPAPEPSTFALGLAGLAGLSVALWRRRRRESSQG